MSHGRNVYLAMKSLQEARDLLDQRFAWSSVLGSESVAVAAAAGRVLAAPVHAAISSPAYHGAAMDGVAVLASTTWGASEATPKELEVGAHATFVNTGEPLPDGCDAVVMIERVQILDDSTIRIEAPAFPWQHVRRVGEDIVATDMLFVRHHRVTPYDVGALMAGGVLQVDVKRRPRVLIVPTGGELIDAGSVGPEGPPPGAIIEFNGTMLGELVRERGGEYVLAAPVADDLEALVSTITTAVGGDYDLVMLIGGSSAGARDLSRAAIASVGEVLVHGVTIMPGKPTVLGAVSDKLVVGIPGYPVSAIVSFEQLVAPALAAMQGGVAAEREELLAHPVRKIASRLGLEEFVRVRLGRVDDRIVAAPLGRGAGAITSITRADGILRIPAHVEGVDAGRPVRVEVLRSRRDIERTLVAIGSHDMTLDVLADLLRARSDVASLTSTSVGSLGGLVALRDGACHLAGCHILDPADGSYNVSYVERYAGDGVRLLHLVEREQGLIVPAGNPRGVRGLEDLPGGDLEFVNRQGGSGTRVLLDYELERRGLGADAIAGYDREETTHMAVAVSVLSGAADVGLGIRAAAQALDLGFVPVATESYDLAIGERHWQLPAMERLRDTMASAEFRRRVAALGGYGTERTGEVVLPTPGS